MGSLLLALGVGALVLATAAPAFRHAADGGSFIGPYTGVATGEQLRSSHADNNSSSNHITSDSAETYQARFTYSFRVEKGEIVGSGQGVYTTATWHLSGENGKNAGFSCDPVVTAGPFPVEIGGFKLDNELFVLFKVDASEENEDYDCGAHFTGYATKSHYLFDSMLDTETAVGAAGYLRTNVAHPQLGHFTSHQTPETDTVKKVIDNTWDITITPPSSNQDDSGGPGPSTAKRKGSGTQMCTINGTAGKDVLHGTSKDDVICGLGGDDSIFGGGGNDVIVGGPGSDRIDGGAGFDALYGDAGNDSFAAKDGNRDRIIGGAGKDRATVDKGKDLATGVEKVS